MKKKHQQDIESALSNALDPPKRKPSPALNEILSQYAPPLSPPEAPSETDTATRFNAPRRDVPHRAAPPDSPPSEIPGAPVAPERDFNRRPNSLERDALPKGLFPGTSKKLYDALYLRTRGAVRPVRSVQATRAEVMRWAGIGGLNTFLSHIKYLTRVGLVIRSFEMGDKQGANYEVRIPEEVNLGPLAEGVSLDSTQLNSTQLDSPPKWVLDSTQKLMRVESSKPLDSKGTYEFPNTSFKTIEKNIDDDDEKDPLAGLGEALRQAAGEITGKAPSTGERERWRELGEVLATELKIAAARTDSISSVPSFLAEHLRRRLWKKDKAQLAKTAAERGKDAAGPERPIEVSKCPDCGGTGFYYPNGYEGGVARCKHENAAPSAHGAAQN